MGGPKHSGQVAPVATNEAMMAAVTATAGPATAACRAARPSNSAKRHQFRRRQRLQAADRPSVDVGQAGKRFYEARRARALACQASYENTARAVQITKKAASVVAAKGSW